MWSANAPRFERLPDGTFYVRVGSQTSCAGVAGIHVRITIAEGPGLTMRTAASASQHADPYGRAVPGFAVLEPFREAIARGARDALVQANRDIGVSLELLDAFVHEVDASDRQFEVAGQTAMRGWLDLEVSRADSPNRPR